MRHSRRAILPMLILTALLLPSCGFKRKLVSITVSPDKATLGGPGLDLQYTAIGNYVHPPDSRDITESVTWASAAPDVVAIDSHGLAVSRLACGTNIPITATAHSDPHDSSSGIVVGTVSVSVTCP
jgi:hypothetical protein